MKQSNKQYRTSNAYYVKRWFAEWFNNLKFWLPLAIMFALIDPKITHQFGEFMVHLFK